MDETEAFLFFNNPANSKSQESAAEYKFLQLLIGQAAGQGFGVNVCRGDFDAFGFDLLLRSGVTTRLIQLKARSGGVDNDGYWDIHHSLLDNPDGIVICARLRLTTGATDDSVPQINYQFKMFDRANLTVARARPPKKPHAGKCKVLERECFDITDTLLQLFA